jgi:hypothetical protein
VSSWRRAPFPADDISQSSIGDNSAAYVEKSWRSLVKNGSATSERRVAGGAIGNNLTAT